MQINHFREQYKTGCITIASFSEWYINFAGHGVLTLVTLQRLQPLGGAPSPIICLHSLQCLNHMMKLHLYNIYENTPAQNEMKQHHWSWNLYREGKVTGLHYIYT